MRHCHSIVCTLAALCPAVLGAMLPPCLGAAPRVYECRQGDTRILSDRPCGENSSLRALDLRDLNGYTPVPPPVRAGEPDTDRSPKPRAPEPITRKPTAPKLRSCWDLQGEIDRIDSRMRLGYTAGVGERLRAQRRQLTDRYAKQRCNTTSRHPRR